MVTHRRQCGNQSSGTRRIRVARSVKRELAKLDRFKRAARFGGDSGQRPRANRH